MERFRDLRTVNVEKEQELFEALAWIGEEEAEAEDGFLPLTMEEARYEAESALMDCVCMDGGANGAASDTPAAAIFEYRGGYQFDVTSRRGDGRYLVFGELDPRRIVSVYLFRDGGVAYVELAAP